jgi:hypothetical protein
MWTEWGVREVGHFVHSLGCTFLTAAGRDLGFASVVEVPARREGPFAHVEEDVRSDSVWSESTTKRVVLLAEFERYAGKKKDLNPKVETLLLAQQRWGCEDATLLLAYWTVGLATLPDHNSLRNIARGGFSAVVVCASRATRRHGSSSTSSLFVPGRTYCFDSKTSFRDSNHDRQILRAAGRPSPW